MKLRKLIVLMLSLMLILTSCGSGSNEATNNANAGNEGKEAPVEAVEVDVTLDLVYMSNYGAKDATILKDQLEKVGIKINLVQTPDYATYKEKVANGDFDIAYSGWTTVTGNPDYAVRSLFTEGGDYNMSGINDKKIEELILRAATETPDQYVKTYGEVEQILMDNAYIIPLYSNNKTQAYNKDVLVPGPEHVRLSKSRSMVWEQFEYNDASMDDSEALLLRQNNGNLTSLDPIKGNDGSINMINTNQYVRLVNLTDTDEVTPEGALSYEFAIADGNEDYYFILQDNVNFASLKGGNAVDTGIMVAAEDVVYSMNRAKDKDSVPNHMTYTLHGNMDEISIVTDMSELESIQTGEGKSIKSVLESGLSNSIGELVDNRASVDNGNGKYQVVKISTKEAFPQVLNFLAHQSAGIVSKDQVSNINDNGGIYGDQNEALEDDHLFVSGPYIMTSKNDQAVYFQKNPGYMTGSKHEARIKNIELKIIPDAGAAVQALFSNEIHVLYSVPALHFEKIQKDASLDIVEMASNSARYVLFNLDEKYGKATLDVNLRNAALHAVDPLPFIQIIESGRAVEITSTVTPLLTSLEGYVNVTKPTDSNKAVEYLNAFAVSK